MKTLITDSVRIIARGYSPAIKTLFNIASDSEKDSPKYVELSELADGPLTVRFSYTEDGATRIGSIYIPAPKLRLAQDSLTVKNNIVSAIESHLSA